MLVSAKCESVVPDSSLDPGEQGRNEAAPAENLSGPAYPAVQCGVTGSSNTL